MEPLSDFLKCVFESNSENSWICECTYKYIYLMTFLELAIKCLEIWINQFCKHDIHHRKKIFSCDLTWIDRQNNYGNNCMKGWSIVGSVLSLPCAPSLFLSALHLLFSWRATNAAADMHGAPVPPSSIIQWQGRQVLCAGPPWLIG